MLFNVLKATLLHTLEGHFRAILSTLTVEVINQYCQQ